MGFRMRAGLERGERIEFFWNGERTQAFRGETIAAALLAAGQRRLRSTADGQPRGVYCGMGVCFECAVSVNGTAGVRACMTLVETDMRVESSWQERTP